MDPLMRNDPGLTTSQAFGARDYPALCQINHLLIFIQSGFKIQHLASKI